MSDWNKQRLEKLISDGIEESLSLEYKGAGAFGKGDKEKIEITKQISSFANSSGGTVIYGIAEFTDDTRKHLPERLDPIRRTDFSKEWLDQIVQTIQPRIEGVVIHPVTISDQDNTVCYVVEVPQSQTAHMARDHRYHKRHNFTTARMEDYEVRDIMNRRTHPKIEASIFVNKRANREKGQGLILVKLVNIGSVLAKQFMVELEVPFDLNGLINVKGALMVEKDTEGDYFLVRLRPNEKEAPLFPGANVTLRAVIDTGVKIEHLDNSPLMSRPFLIARVFADEMPAIKTKLEIAPILSRWTPIA